MAFKTVFALVLCQVGFVASLEAGDCAFVGVYGDKDDFAVVMMEHNKGDEVFLTEEYPTDDRFKVSKFIQAKDYVSQSRKGTVLKKGDFEMEPTSLIAPTSLTLFSGSAAEPTVLCSINMEAKQGNVAARHLSEEVPMIMLGLTETAQYAGATQGTKESLLEDISNPSNWIRDASRQLAAFSIASGSNTTTVMTTMPPNTTMMTTTTTMEGTTLAPAKTVVAACTELGGDVAALIANSADAASAFGKAIAGLGNFDASYVQNVVFATGTTCSGRRLSGARRLQTAGTVNYDLVFPASLGAAGAKAAADQAVATVSALDATAVSSALTTEMASYPSLANVQVTVTSVGTFTVTESGGSTPAPTTTTTALPVPPSSANGKNWVLTGLLVAFMGHCIM